MKSAHSPIHSRQKYRRHESRGLAPRRRGLPVEQCFQSLGGAGPAAASRGDAEQKSGFRAISKTFLAREAPRDFLAEAFLFLLILSPTVWALFLLLEALFTR